MSLERYTRKRDFRRTPEPAGAPETAGARAAGIRSAPSGTRRFVVQRHRATRLHYDFRLEIDGVLMSWAVPKGPSLDPAEKRMAVHVEDHPIEYFDFDGVIPAGQYGGGDVIVWDWGTFEPEETDDPAAAVRAGELKVRLEGEKLKGRFVLVRSSGRRRGAAADPDKDEWLLIHKRDEGARSGWDIDQLPRSVKTGRTNDEVKEGRDAVWDSGADAAEASIDLTGAAETPMPEFIEPMRATPVSGPFSDPDWLFELKLDGYRVEAHVEGGSVRLWTRNRQDAARYFPDLAGAPSWIAARQAIVDGEVVALDEEGRPSFSLLQDRTGLRTFGRRAREPGDGRVRATQEAARPAPVVYYCFDLLYLDGRSLIGVPLEERKKLLRSVLRESGAVRFATHVAEDGLAYHAAAAERDLEGIVAKHRRSVYEPGRRSRSWLKVKIRQEQELVVGGYEPGKGSHADLGSLIVGVYEGDRLRFCGQVGSGLDARTRRQFVERLGALRRDDPPFEDAPRIRNAHWAEPRIVIRAEFAEWTSDGLLRQAAYKGLEPDRDPRTVHRERQLATGVATRAAERAVRAVAVPEPELPPQDAPGGLTGDELTALDGMTKDGPWEVGGFVVRLSNLDKVLFPDPGYTKRDLIRYYASVAHLMLPYLADRGLTLHRFPNGVAGPGFWAKEIPPNAPEWMDRWFYQGSSPREAHTYIVADRPAALAFVANQGAIDLHPWTSRRKAPDRPTYALIDVDPGEQTTWQDVVLLTRLYGTALRHLGVRGYPKVTGKRGIQVWIPIEPRYTFDETRDWVEGVSRAVGQTVPELVSWEWQKTQRRGLARLDYTQNAVNKTLVAPYAVRPAAGAPVSTPITWEELDDPELRPNRWTIANVLQRVQERGDFFSGTLQDPQVLPPL
jgi:bifunctional non-homologous end joining protein LigD